MGLAGAGERERTGWWLTLYPEAGEAGGSFRYAKPPAVGGPAREPDPERAASEAARRARANLRRYCTANGLNRLGTLTFAGAGCHDPKVLRGHLGVFFRNLRHGLGGAPFPYAWVPEWHKTDHGLHAHFAVGRFIKRSLIVEAWGHGFVHIKLLGDLPVGSGRFEEARKAARYLAKYAGKAVDDRRIPSLHRYDVAQGFKPRSVRVWGRTSNEAIDRAAAEWMAGKAPSYRWSSDEVRDWKAPPSVWVSWSG